MTLKSAPKHDLKQYVTIIRADCINFICAGLEKALNLILKTLQDYVQGLTAVQ